MNHLDFILWLVLAPVAVSIMEYFGAKKRKLTGKKEKQFPDHVNERFAWICFAIYAIIAIKLY